MRIRATSISLGIYEATIETEDGDVLGHIEVNVTDWDELVKESVEHNIEVIDEC